MPVTWSDEKLILLYCPGRGRMCSVSNDVRCACLSLVISQSEALRFFSGDQWAVYDV